MSKLPSYILDNDKIRKYKDGTTTKCVMTDKEGNKTELDFVPIWQIGKYKSTSHLAYNDNQKLSLKNLNGVKV